MEATLGEEILAWIKFGGFGGIPKNLPNLKILQFAQLNSPLLSKESLPLIFAREISSM